MSVFTDALDDIFANDAFALDATYKVGGAGAGVPVRVIRVKPGDAIAALAAIDLVSSTNLLELRQSEIADPAAGDTLTVMLETGGATVLTVQGAPKFDQVKLTWILDCQA